VLAASLALLASACGGGGLGAASRPAGEGLEVNVSNAPGAQAETMLAVDPSDPKILVGGSNDILTDQVTGTEAGFGGMRAYSSTDGGRTWQQTVALPLPGGINRGDGCTSDPALTVDLQGRQFYGFVQMPHCLPDYFGMQLYVAWRANATAPWRTSAIPVAATRVPHWDDKPTLIADLGRASRHRGRLYIAFTRFTKAAAQIMISHSDDGAGHWSTATPVSPPVNVKKLGVTGAGLASLPNGSIAATWEAGTGVVYLAKSADGVRFGAPHALGKLPIPLPKKKKLTEEEADCKGIPVPSQPGRCISAGPTVAADTSGGPHAGTIYTAWVERDPDGTTDVVERSFSPSLVAGPSIQFSGAGKSDQMQPAITVDRTTGTVVLCYYDSSGDWTRIHVLYTCTESRDGGSTWTTPIAAASQVSDATQPGMHTWFNYGEYQGVAAANGEAHPMWTDARAGGLNSTEIYTTTLNESALH
jgi:hypothetical protein